MDVDPHRLRDAEPEAARRHHRRGVRGADPRCERADGPDHVRVAVAPDDELPGVRVPPFRDELVDDPVVPDVMEPLDPLLLAELADRLVHLRDLRRWGRDPVVQGDDNLVRVPDLHRADVIERHQGHREHLVHVEEVDGPVDDVPWRNVLLAARARKDLLGDREARHGLHAPYRGTIHKDGPLARPRSILLA